MWAESHTHTLAFCRLSSAERGVCNNLDAACSSGYLAAEMALEELASHRCGEAIIGGVQLLLMGRPVPAMQWAYDRYSFNVIPAMGQAVTGDRDSYQYLVESIRKFPDQEAFGALIREAGFGRVQWRNLSMGIAALHSGWKL